MPRIAYIDTAKGIAALLIVFLHLAPVQSGRMMWLFVYCVPLFFCISGMFYKDYGSWDALLRRKAATLLLPFAGWYAIGYLIHAAGHTVTGIALEDDFSFFKVFRTNEIFNLPVWFFLSLFWTTLIYYAIDRVVKSALGKPLSVAALAGVGLLMSHFGVFNALYIGSSLSCLPFYYFGVLAGSTLRRTPGREQRRIAAAALAASAATLLGIDLWLGLPDFACYRNELVSGSLVSFYICAVSFSAALLALSALVGNVGVLSWFGRHTVVVLSAHLQPGVVIASAISALAGDYAEGETVALLTFVSVLALMPLIVWLSKKYLPHISGVYSWRSGN
ncbi:MAG: acyltransferase family protein [Muribaculaceae bacterium]|nr:acyltransferase family protein [Muribaculaceae bacterium]